MKKFGLQFLAWSIFQIVVLEDTEPSFSASESFHSLHLQRQKCQEAAALHHCLAFFSQAFSSSTVVKEAGFGLGALGKLALKERGLHVVMSAGQLVPEGHKASIWLWYFLNHSVQLVSSVGVYLNCGFADFAEIVKSRLSTKSTTKKT